MGDDLEPLQVELALNTSAASHPLVPRTSAETNRSAPAPPTKAPPQSAARAACPPRPDSSVLRTVTNGACFFDAISQIMYARGQPEALHRGELRGMSADWLGIPIEEGDAQSPWGTERRARADLVGSMRVALFESSTMEEARAALAVRGVGPDSPDDVLMQTYTSIARDESFYVNLPDITALAWRLCCRVNVYQSQAEPGLPVGPEEDGLLEYDVLWTNAALGPLYGDQNHFEGLLDPADFARPPPEVEHTQETQDPKILAARFLAELKMPQDAALRKRGIGLLNAMDAPFVDAYAAAIVESLLLHGPCEVCLGALETLRVHQPAAALLATQAPSLIQILHAESADFSKKKVPELRKELQAAGLNDKGKKDELVERLTCHSGKLVEMCTAVSTVLCSLEPSALAPHAHSIIELLSNEHENVRKRARWILTYRRAHPAAHIKSIVNLLEHPNAGVCSSAAVVLFHQDTRILAHYLPKILAAFEAHMITDTIARRHLSDVLAKLAEVAVTQTDPPECPSDARLAVLSCRHPRLGEGCAEGMRQLPDELWLMIFSTAIDTAAIAKALLSSGSVCPKLPTTVMEGLRAALAPHAETLLAPLSHEDSGMRDSAVAVLRDAVLTAVQQDGRALEYAASALQADREVVLAAVQQNGRALCFVSQELQADREVVLAAVQQNAAALEIVSRELRADREVVLAAVQQDGRALEYAASALQVDREVVLAAVQQNGRALCFVSQELQADHEVVLAAKDTLLNSIAEFTAHGEQIPASALSSIAIVIKQLEGIEVPRTIDQRRIFIEDWFKAEREGAGGVDHSSVEFS